MIVAIDGPAGTGKGTVSKLIAQRMNFTYIDTGAMYRCITLKMIRNNIEITELGKIQELLNNTSIDFENAFDDEGNYFQKVFLDGEDVTEEIRTPKVNERVSPYSNEPIIRSHLVKMQKEYASSKDIIMEGRDITTVVFPDAEVKIYLDATPEERANRRYKELVAKGVETTYEETLEAINKRDYNDRTKPVGALKIAEGATIVDTTTLTIEEVYESLRKIILEHGYIEP
ncbi:MAG: (d)CMP kinase [Clostridia bacterium]|nr:(d)CMP kinase [Clostridia bacterium]